MKDLDTMQMPALSPQHTEGYWIQDIVVLNKHGLHARPSAKIFEKILMPYGSQLELHFDIDGRSPMHIRSVFDLMSLGLEQGTHVKVRVKYLGAPEGDQIQEMKILTDLHNLFVSFCED